VSLCLLSRGLQKLGLSTSLTCLRLSKVLNSLLCESLFFHSRCSTSQPGQPKNLFRLTPPLVPLIEFSTSLFRGSGHACNGPLACPIAPSDHSFHSHDATPDPICLVCGSQSFTSCPVCEQDFCKIHLYACLDCGNQYCGSCLNDHRAEGHWTDSDTSVELNRGWKASSPSALRPTENRGFIAHSAQGLSSEQSANQGRSCAISAAARNKSSSRASQSGTLLASRFARVFRSVRLCLSWLGAYALGNMFSQFAHYPEARP
jgi:hypothetical protein